MPNTATEILTGTAAMEARRERGLRIAQHMKIKKTTFGTYIVPSESKATSYVVEDDGARGTVCSCPDWELRREACKHIYAVNYSRRSETMADGSIKTVETLKVSYRQNWPAYNKAQTNEKADVAKMLRALCDGVQEAPQEGRGQRRAPVGDRLFALVMKTYDGMSARRSSTDMREWADKGMLSKALSFSTVIEAFEDPSLTPVLTAMIEEAAAPLKAVESQFAIDSTAFSTCTYRRWYDEKYGKERSEAQWVKAHTMVGAKTNVVCSVIVTDNAGADCPQLPALTESTAKNFDMREVSADKAYLSNENMTAIQKVGALPFIAFKVNSLAKTSKTVPIWTKMFHCFQFKREEYMSHYNQRSNVECTYSGVKRKFGGALRSKTFAAQTNEVLAKFLCWNLSCLVHALYELGIVSEFWQETPAPMVKAVSPAWDMIELPEETTPDRQNVEVIAQMSLW